MTRRETPPAKDHLLSEQTLDADTLDAEGEGEGARGRARAPGGQPLTRGDEVGRYVILERVGAGGMGVVHAAWDPKLDRKIALKLLHGDKIEHSQRLEREAQAMARLAHQNVIAVHDVGEVDGRVFVAMEFIEGQTLGEWAGVPSRDTTKAASADPGRARDEAALRPWPEVLAALLAAGRGLAAAHAQGLVHRDFKPDNVMVGEDGRVSVMDFGLVRAARGAGERASGTGSGTHAALTDSALIAKAQMHAELTQASALESDLTRSGALVGTPAYMAPEQLRGDEADARSDQFAYCLVAWQCLYGARPFAGETPLAVLFAISQAKFEEPPPGRDVPNHVRRVLERGLSAAPEERWPSMDALLAALADDPSSRRRPWLLGGASLLLAAAAAVAAILVQPAPAPSPCAEVGASMTGLWSEARAAELGEAFARSELAYAEETWAHAAPLLDAWSTRWIAARRDACEATQVRHEQSPELLDLRMTCLDERARRLTALLEVFAAADDSVVERAIEAVEALPAIEICSDRSWLTASVRPPEDPEVAAKLDELRGRVATIEALTVGGKAQAALADAELALRDAEALGWQPAVAEAGVALGQARQEAGAFAESRDALETAFFAARRANHDEATIRASFLLDYTLSVGLGEFEAARQWSKHGLAEATRVGRDDLLAQVHAGIGIRHYLSGEMPEAADAFAQSLALAPADGSVARASAHINYGTVLIRVDPTKPERAFAELDRGLAMLEDRVGPTHPTLATALSNYATVYGYIDEQAKAVGLLERALAIDVRALGAKHPMTALVQLNLAANLVKIGERETTERALVFANTALATHVELFGEDHAMVAESRLAVATALLELGRPEDAIAQLDVAEGVWLEKFGPTNLETLTARVARARCLDALGRREEAITILEDVLASDSQDARTLARAALALAEVLVDDDRERARSLLERAIEGSADARRIAALRDVLN